MNKIFVKVLNPNEIKSAESNLVLAGRLTQRGEKISSLEDFEKLKEKEFNSRLVYRLSLLSHRSIMSLNLINIVIIGASRRFTSQITRHHEANFISASLQYSDYSNDAQFQTLPDEFVKEQSQLLLQTMELYDKVKEKYGNDIAGYVMPQSLKNVLIISATPYVWAHIIKQRLCKRNTKETQLIIAECYKQLHNLSKELFNGFICLPNCVFEGCSEGKMSCNNPFAFSNIDDIIKEINEGQKFYVVQEC